MRTHYFLPILTLGEMHWWPVCPSHYLVVLENIHTYTTGSISKVWRGRGRGVHRLEFRGHGEHIGLEFQAWVIFRSGLPEGEYRFSNRALCLITQKKGKQSTKGLYINWLDIRFLQKPYFPLGFSSDSKMVLSIERHLLKWFREQVQTGLIFFFGVFMNC